MNTPKLTRRGAFLAAANALAVPVVATQVPSPARLAPRVLDTWAIDAGPSGGGEMVLMAYRDWAAMPEADRPPAHRSSGGGYVLFRREGGRR